MKRTTQKALKALDIRTPKIDVDELPFGYVSPRDLMSGANYNTIKTALLRAEKAEKLYKASKALLNIMGNDATVHFGKKYGSAFVKAVKEFK